MKHLKTYKLFETVGQVWPTSKLGHEHICQELNDIGHELDEFTVFVHENPPYKMDGKLYPVEIRVSIYDHYGESGTEDRGSTYRKFNYIDVMEVINRMVEFMKSENWEISNSEYMKSSLSSLGYSWNNIDLSSPKKYIDIEQISLIFIPIVQ